MPAVSVSVADGGPDEQTLKHAVEGAGYDVASINLATEADDEADAAAEHSYLSLARKRLWIAGVPTTLIMALMVVHMFWQSIPGYLPIVVVLAFPVVFLYGGATTHLASWRSLKNRTFNMDVLISMGAALPDWSGGICLSNDLICRNGSDDNDVSSIGSLPRGEGQRASLRSHSSIVKFGREDCQSRTRRC